MTASTFDTLATADRLRDAGFDDAQSRAIVGIHRDAGETLVTKADLALWSQGVGIVCKKKNPPSSAQESAIRRRIHRHRHRSETRPRRQFTYGLNKRV